VRRADNLTTFMYRLYSNLGASNSWNPDGLSRPVLGLIYILYDGIDFKLLGPTGYVMHQQFNIQQLYALPTLCLCVLCLSENKQRLVPLTA